MREIARMNQRITFQRNTVSVDQYRNHVQSWEDYFSCFAYANTYQAEEDGDVVTSEERKVTFEARFCPELAAVTSTEYRIIFSGVAYNIESVDMMNYQGREIRFTCRREKR